MEGGESNVIRDTRGGWRKWRRRGLGLGKKETAGEDWKVSRSVHERLVAVKWQRGGHYRGLTFLVKVACRKRFEVTFVARFLSFKAFSRPEVSDYGPRVPAHQVSQPSNPLYMCLYV